VQKQIPHAAMAGADEFLVIGLCAAWCGTCREFRDTFDALKAARPDRRFVWLDIEDDSALAGDLDIENFPSLAVFVGERALFYGVTEPAFGTVARLLDALEVGTATTAVPLEVTALREAIAVSLRGKGSGREIE